MTLEPLGRLSAGEARLALERCCGARRWVDAVLAGHPYPGTEALWASAERAFDGLGPEDWLEAFAHHPRIGDAAAGSARLATTAAWAGAEQCGATVAPEATRAALAEANHAYQERFGYIFIVCAAGKSADQMLALLRARLANAPEDELAIAAAEQRQITRLRIEKLLEEER